MPVKCLTHCLAHIQTFCAIFTSIHDWGDTFQVSFYLRWIKKLSTEIQKAEDILFSLLLSLFSPDSSQTMSLPLSSLLHTQANMVVDQSWGWKMDTTVSKIARCPGPDTACPQGCTCLYNPCLAPFHIFSQGNEAPDDPLSLVNNTDPCCFPKTFLLSLPSFLPSFHFSKSGAAESFLGLTLVITEDGTAKEGGYGKHQERHTVWIWLGHNLFAKELFSFCISLKLLEKQLQVQISMYSSFLLTYVYADKTFSV